MRVGAAYPISILDLKFSFAKLCDARAPEPKTKIQTTMTTLGQYRHLLASAKIATQDVVYVLQDMLLKHVTGPVTIVSELEICKGLAKLLELECDWFWHEDVYEEAVPHLREVRLIHYKLYGLDTSRAEDMGDTLYRIYNVFLQRVSTEPSMIKHTRGTQMHRVLFETIEDTIATSAPPLPANSGEQKQPSFQNTPSHAIDRGRNNGGAAAAAAAPRPAVDGNERSSQNRLSAAALRRKRGRENLLHRQQQLAKRQHRHHDGGDTPAVGVDPVSETGEFRGVQINFDTSKSSITNMHDI